MRTERQLLPLKLPNISNISFTFILLNVRSLNKHSIDVYVTKDYERQIFYLSQKHKFHWVRPQKDGKNTYQNFTFFHNKSKDKNQSLAFCAKDNVEIDTLPMPWYIIFFGFQSINGFSIESFTSVS